MSGEGPQLGAQGRPHAPMVPGPRPSSLRTPPSRRAPGSRWPGIILRGTVFATVFLAGNWVTPTLLARQFGTNPRANFRSASRAEPRVIVRDGDLSWATAKIATQAVVANPYVPGGPKGTTYREVLRTFTYQVTVWDLPGKAPSLDAVLLQVAARDRSGAKTTPTFKDQAVGGMDGRWMSASLDDGLPSSRDVDAIAMVAPKAGDEPARLVLVTRSYPSTARTVGGLAPPEAQEASIDELRGILASFQQF